MSGATARRCATTDLNRMVEFRNEATGSVARYGYDCLGRWLTKSVSDANGGLEVRYTFGC